MFIQTGVLPTGESDLMLFFCVLPGDGSRRKAASIRLNSYLNFAVIMFNLEAKDTNKHHKQILFPSKKQI